MPNCVHCGKSYSVPIYRNTLCAQCGRELKTCRNCLHFAPGQANDCREPVSEPVREKDRSNFCDWFTPASKAVHLPGDDTAGNKADAARQAFAQLFSNE
ncbi:MAG: hypothetical protein B0D92_05235 [Spirochaeta sp. LUC14_002_19_P3]|nr:MAG: hypothetical protein B0D92_05235 [Spirochaeta sp. LUC14_002_19_P3]